MNKQRPTTAKPAINQKELRELRESDQAQFQQIGSNSSHFVILAELGKGSYGTVFKVKSTVDNNVYVLKKINLTHLKPKHQNEALKEAQLLRKLKHPNIISYYMSFIENEYLCIVMEYAEGGDLQKFLKEFKEKRKFVPEELIWEMARELASALQHIHENKIIHRDIKTLNIFLTRDRKIKLGDLGVSKIFNSEIALEGTRVGTPLYLSPELVQHQPYDYKVDVWALGCVIFQLAALEPPFSGDNLIALGYSIVNKSPKPLPVQYSMRLNLIINKLLEKIPALRPSIMEVIGLITNQQTTRDRVQIFNLYEQPEIPQRPQTSHVRSTNIQQQETEKVKKIKKELVQQPENEHTQRQIEADEKNTQNQRFQQYQQMLKEEKEKQEKEKQDLEREREKEQERAEKLRIEKLEREKQEKERIEKQAAERELIEKAEKERREREALKQRECQELVQQLHQRQIVKIQNHHVDLYIQEIDENRRTSFTIDQPKPKLTIKLHQNKGLQIRPMSAQARGTSFAHIQQMRAKILPQSQHQEQQPAKKFTIFDLKPPQQSQQQIQPQQVESDSEPQIQNGLGALPPPVTKDNLRIKSAAYLLQGRRETNMIVKHYTLRDIKD